MVSVAEILPISFNESGQDLETYTIYLANYMLSRGVEDEIKRRKLLEFVDADFISS